MNRAQGEVIARDTLNEVMAWLKVFEIKLQYHGKDLLVTHWRETLATVGEKLSVLVSLKDSQHYGVIADSATLYEERILVLDDVLHKLNHVQRKVLYLEPVLSNKSFPNESQSFQLVNDNFSLVLSKLKVDPRLYQLVEGSKGAELQAQLESDIKDLELCQKSLAVFMQKKRFVMPRLYFLGDDILLEILGQQNNPNTLQTHMKDLFQGIDSVLLDSSENSIVGMKSAQGEEVLFDEVRKQREGSI